MRPHRTRPEKEPHEDRTLLAWRRPSAVMTKLRLWADRMTPARESYPQRQSVEACPGSSRQDRALRPARAKCALPPLTIRQEGEPKPKE